MGTLLREEERRKGKLTGTYQNQSKQTNLYRQTFVKDPTETHLLLQCFLPQTPVKVLILAEPWMATFLLGATVTVQEPLPRAYA